MVGLTFLTSCVQSGDQNRSAMDTEELDDQAIETEVQEQSKSHADYIIGKWVGDEGVIGYPFELTFEADGTYTNIIGGEDVPGTYEISGETLKVDNKHLKNGQNYSIVTLNDSDFVFEWDLESGTRRIPMKRLVE